MDLAGIHPRQPPRDAAQQQTLHVLILQITDLLRHKAIAKSAKFTPVLCRPSGVSEYR